MTDYLTPAVDAAAQVYHGRLFEALPWDECGWETKHLSREAMLPVVLACAPVIRADLQAEVDRLTAVIACVESLADDWDQNTPLGLVAMSNRTNDLRAALAPTGDGTPT